MGHRGKRKIILKFMVLSGKKKVKDKKNWSFCLEAKKSSSSLRTTFIILTVLEMKTLLDNFILSLVI